jgi:multidrug efflux pump subunit AcrA (membrane-fusion protein)
MYASVHMDIDEHTNVVAIPVEAVSHKAIPTVYVINKENIIEERKVKLGIEAPDRVEALDGVHEGELVMVGGRGQVKPGQKVQPKILETANTLVND